MTGIDEKDGADAPRDVVVDVPCIDGGRAEALTPTVRIENRLNEIEQILKGIEQIEADTKDGIKATNRSVTWTQVGVIVAIFLSLLGIGLQYFKII